MRTAAVIGRWRAESGGHIDGAPFRASGGPGEVTLIRASDGSFHVIWRPDGLAREVGFGPGRASLGPGILVLRQAGGARAEWLLGDRMPIVERLLDADLGEWWVE